ncbi:MAG: NYN domain-containing protein [Alphaproteobacteria bacterium]
MLPRHADVCLSALFIDFDNIYLSLKSRDEEAASRFARNPSFWLSQVVSGALIRTDEPLSPLRRKIIVARCYGNPVPRRSGREGSGDPSSFAFVRHNFMRAGMEVVDCPHLTSQFKNSSDIRIACDVRDYIDHPTRFDEFIILSGDADFTPVLLSLRSHNRQTVIYTNDYTSPYYKAFSDGRIQEDDLIQCLLQPDGAIAEDKAPAIEQQQRAQALEGPQRPQSRVAQAQRVPALEQPQHVPNLVQPQAVPSLETPRMPNLEQQQAAVPQSPVSSRQLQPVAAAVADTSRKRRPAGSDAAIQSLIEDFKVIGNEILALVLDVVENSEKPVPLAYLADRAQKALGHPKTIGTNWAGSGGFLNFLSQNLPEALRLSEKPPHFVYNPAKHRLREESQPAEPQQVAQANPGAAALHQREQAAAAAAGNTGRLAELQRSITRIYEACQAPPLPPSEYQLLFTLIAAEVRENGFAPDRSAEAVVKRAGEAGLKLAAKDVAFVIEAVDEIDPWLEHTRSPSAVARAYRDYVLSRCQQACVSLTDDEYQLIQVWFGASQWTGNSPQAETKPEVQNEAPRRFTPPEHALPAPGSSGDVRLADYGYPEMERAPEPQTKAGALRYSFLKHG